MAVLIGDIVPSTSVFNDDQLQLEGAFGIRPVTVGEQTFIYVAGRLDGGLSAFEVGSDGSLTNIQNIDDGGPELPLQLRGATHLTSITVGTSQYLYVTGSLDDGLSVFKIQSDGTLSNIQNINDSMAPSLELDGVSGKPAVATVGDVTYLITSGDDDNGLSVFRVGPDGKLLNTDNISDDATLNLDDAHDVVSATVGGRVFVCVIGGDDSGISVFELRADGTLSSTFNISDDATRSFGNPWGLASATVDGVTYVIASGRSDSGLSVFALDDMGTLTDVASLGDDVARGLAGAFGLTTFVLDGETFVVASGTEDSALTVFHLGAGGTLTDVTTIFDTAATGLGYTVDNAFAVVDGRPLLLATGYLEGGLTTFEIGAGNDLLTGGGSADLLLGLAGDDVLDGMGGNDRMIGGSGNDTYIVDDLADQVVEQSQAGSDRVRSLIDYTLGDDVEDLFLLGRTDLDATGNGLANFLSGNGGANRLAGLGGEDRLRGGGGRDTVLGGAGNDDLSGGQGRDRLVGGSGADHFIFSKVGHSSPQNGTRDIVLNFQIRDVIDLSAIDAVKGRGNQDFALDQNGTFSAGEIGLLEVKAGLLLRMNVDGDARAEMSLLLKGFDGNLDDGNFIF